MYVILLECLILVILIYLIFLLMFYKIKMDFESVSVYECGFDVKSKTRMSFSLRFFLISILFLIFDVEISLMLPVPFLMQEVLSVWVFFVFILVLILGLLYEYYCGSLDWLDILVFKI